MSQATLVLAGVCLLMSGCATVGDGVDCMRGPRLFGMPIESAQETPYQKCMALKQLSRQYPVTWARLREILAERQTREAGTPAEAREETGAQAFARGLKEGAVEALAEDAEDPRDKYFWDYFAFQQAQREIGLR